MMNNFTIGLEKGSKTGICISCQHKTLKYYVVYATGERINDSVGRCNREDKCGYHMTPKQFFGENKPFDTSIYKIANVNKIKKQLFTIDIKQMEDTLCNYPNNTFAVGLKNYLGEKAAVDILTKYECIGTSNKYIGATIFWYIDKTGKVITGKVMKYDTRTLKRSKDFITWAHVGLINENTHERKTAFFGEHLLTLYPNKPIAIFEAEKTAIICSHFFPEFNCLAAGNINGLTYEKFIPLKGLDVVLFPDLGKGYEVWNKKAKEFASITNIKVSNYLNNHATQDDVLNGLDLADILLNVGSIP